MVWKEREASDVRFHATLQSPLTHPLQGLGKHLDAIIRRTTTESTDAAITEGRELLLGVGTALTNPHPCLYAAAAGYILFREVTTAGGRDKSSQIKDGREEKQKITDIWKL